MEEVFKYIIGLGAAVMMPVIFTILGVCIGIKFAQALKSGLLVGVGFVGLSVVTALLTSSLGPALSKMVEIYGLELGIFDMGWPSAAAVAYNTSVGALSRFAWVSTSLCWLPRQHVLSISTFGTIGTSHLSEPSFILLPTISTGDSSLPSSATSLRW